MAQLPLEAYILSNYLPPHLAEKNEPYIETHKGDWCTLLGLGLSHYSFPCVPPTDGGGDKT